MQWLKLKQLMAAIAAVVAIVVFSLPAIALADETPSGESIPEVEVPATVDSSAISSEKVSQFATAYLGIIQLIDRRSDELQSAETTDEYQQVERELEAEAVELINDTGLTPQEYLQLLTLADTDADFGERIATQLQEMQH